MSIIRSKYYGIIRGVTVGIAFLIQIVTMILLAMYLLKAAVIIYFIFEVISVLTVFALVNNSESYKIGWIIIILIIPVAGVFLYFMWGRRRNNSKYFKRFRTYDLQMRESLVQDEEAAKDLEQCHPNKVQISRYLRKSGFPIYKNTEAVYYEVGEDAISAITEDLKGAKIYFHGIFYRVRRQSMAGYTGDFDAES